MGQLERFVAFAFAGADLLLEVSAEGRVVYAAGATGGAAPDDKALIGRDASALFEARDRPLLSALVRGLDDGARGGPVCLSAAPATGWDLCAVSAYRMPGAATTAVVVSARAQAAILRAGDGPGGLHDAADADAFAGPVLQMARNAGHALDLMFLELQGLTDALDALDDVSAETVRGEVAGAVRAESYGGAAAARLGPETFAVLRRQGEPADRAAERLTRVLGHALSEPLTVKADARPLDADADEAMKLVRAALRQALSEGAGARAGGLKKRVAATLEQAARFRGMVVSGRFALVFQPVVALADRAIHHHEVLVRFPDGKSPFETIRMAESLDLIAELDLAVLKQALKRLKTDPDPALSLAVNMSARSLSSPAFVTEASRLLVPSLADRLLVEITESATLQDVDAAGRVLARWRKDGFDLCLDDFGQGAASMDMLRRLPVSTVKIDGAYVKDMTADPASLAVVKSVARLCRDLNKRSVAEMVETEETHAALLALGVDYGQGWLYGKATPEPLRDRPLPPLNLRRQGARESWG